MKRFFCLFSLFIFSGILSSGEKSIFILNTTDTHSHIEDVEDEFGRIADLLRLSTALQERKSILEKKGKVFLIDCGDTIQGTFPAAIFNGCIGLEFLKENKFDVWVPGNHDFDFGYRRLQELISQKDGINVLCANVDIPACPAWKEFSSENIKIIVIGATLPYLNFMSLECNNIFKIKNFDFELEKIIPNIMEKSPNAIILAIHHGIYAPKIWGGLDLSSIAAQYPQINLVLGGHSHQDYPGEKIGPATWFVQAGAHACVFAEIELIFDDETGKLIDIRSELFPITKKIPRNTSLEAKISGFLSETAKIATEIIGKTSSPIPSVEPGTINCEIRELLSKALSGAAKTDIVLSDCGTGHANFAEEITVQDVYNLLPYQDTICTLEFSPEEFKIVMNEQISNFGQNHFLSPYGLFCETEEQNKISKIKTPDGKEWTSGRKKIALSSYAAAGAGGRFRQLANFAKTPECRLSDSGIKLRDAVTKYIQMNSPLPPIVPTEWIKLKNTKNNVFSTKK